MFALVKPNNSFLDLISNSVSVLLTFSFDVDAIESLGKRTDDWPVLDIVLGHVGYRGVLKGQIKGIEPVAVVADDDGSIDFEVLQVFTVVFYLHGQVVHQLPIVVEVPNENLRHLCSKLSIP